MSDLQLIIFAVENSSSEPGLKIKRQSVEVQQQLETLSCTTSLLVSYVIILINFEYYIKTKKMI